MTGKEIYEKINKLVIELGDLQIAQEMLKNKFKPDYIVIKLLKEQSKEKEKELHRLENSVFSVEAMPLIEG